jgi:hypothetical protein
MVLSIRNVIFLSNTFFKKAIDTPDHTPPDFYLWGAAKSAAYRDRPRVPNESRTAITAYLRNISQAGQQKVFANKIKRFQACIDVRGHHFQQLL